MQTGPVSRCFVGRARAGPLGFGELFEVALLRITKYLKRKTESGPIIYQRSDPVIAHYGEHGRCRIVQALGAIGDFTGVALVKSKNRIKTEARVDLLVPDYPVVFIGPFVRLVQR